VTYNEGVDASTVAATTTNTTPTRTRIVCSKLVIIFASLGVMATMLALVVTFVFDEIGQWSDWEGHTCDEYCENSHQCYVVEESQRPPVQQPVDAWTNLAYMFVGLIPLIMIRIDISTMVYCIVCTMVAISSFMFHASITIFWRDLDACFMYTLFTTLVFHGLRAVFGISWKFLVVPFLAWMAILPFVKSRMDEAHLGSNVVNFFQLCCICILMTILALARIRGILNGTIPTRHNNRSSRCFAIIEAILIPIIPGIIHACAIMVWTQDANKSWCNPESSFQWHGVWHVLTSFVSLLIWLYFDLNHLSDILTRRSTNFDDNVDKQNKDERRATTSDSTEQFQLGDESEFQIHEASISHTVTEEQARHTEQGIEMC
jgi:hypothetical protein